MSKSSTSGDGVTGHVFHNGVEVDVAQIAGNDRTGVTRTVVITGVEVGDTIDFALDPTGLGGDPLQPDGDGDRTSVDLVYTRQAELESSITTDIRTAMHGVSSSAYVRVPFFVNDLSALDELTLKMRYDDGFVAYINGVPVAAANAPDVVGFDSVSLAERSVEDASAYESFDLTAHRDLFWIGENVLAIHALNASAGDDDLLVLPELIVGTGIIQQGQLRYFLQPTPGQPNGLGVDQVGPLVIDVQHTPNVPTAAEPIVITAEVARTFRTLGDVELTYRVMFEDELTVAMTDDGTGGDVLAGDGIYTATLPAGVAPAGQMVRWYVTAKDADGRGTRFPSFEDPNTTQQYLGTMIDDPSVESNLPVIHWFIENRGRAMITGGDRGAIFFEGELYDNVYFNLHGQSSSGFPTQKKSMNVDFARDHRFLWTEDLARMEDINLLTNFADKAKVRNTLAYEQRAFAGAGYHLAYPVRVQHNGEFFAVYDFVEDPDEAWLDRLDLNADGALYKMYNSMELGHRRKEDAKRRRSPTICVIWWPVRDCAVMTCSNYLFDNINLAGMVNYLAAFVLTSNRDCCHKNYYAYRDTGITDEWHYLIWDVDLSQGRNWGGFGLAYFDDTMYPDNALLCGIRTTS